VDVVGDAVEDVDVDVIFVVICCDVIVAPKIDASVRVDCIYEL
jgi:hypothetical protein